MMSWIARLDLTSGSFWRETGAILRLGGLTQPAVLDRLLHRRASVQLGRLEEADGGLAERPTIEGAEFYLSPRITTELRLGQIMKRKNEYRVVLTPHCYLAVQPGQSAPRADFILTVAAVPATAVFDSLPFTGNDVAKMKELRRRIQSPARFGQPEGRYWFLPGFLTMPDLYADLLQLQSLPTRTCSVTGIPSRFWICRLPRRFNRVSCASTRLWASPCWTRRGSAT